MSLRRSIALTVVLFALSSFACGGDPPDKEIQQAQNAIDQARAAGADRYAVEEYTAAVDALTHAHSAVDQRDYRLALNDALDSRERAENAAKLAADGKTAARSAAEKALTAATASLSAADAKVKAATAARPARTLTEAHAALDEAQKHVQEARTAFNGGDYYGALSAASATTQSAKTAIDKIDAPATAQPRRRPGAH
jgi:hypothetical protein